MELLLKQAENKAGSCSKAQPQYTAEQKSPCRNQTVDEREMCYSARVKQKAKEFKLRIKTLSQITEEDVWGRDGAEDERIFPLTHRAAIAFFENTEPRVRPMRYGTFMPENMPKKYSSFNARADNIRSPFWQSAFLQGHGVVTLSGFFEWVAVKDLLNTGCVSLAEIEEEFERQRLARKKRILAAGKAYKPTKTELKAAPERKIVIEFNAGNQNLLSVPVIFNRRVENGEEKFGFAIITRDPPPEIATAGHDRCPVILNEEQALHWMQPRSSSPQSLTALLQQEPQVHFQHVLDRAA